MTSLLKGVVNWLDGSTEGLEDENLVRIEADDIKGNTDESETTGSGDDVLKELDEHSSNTAAMKEDLMEVSMKAVHTAKEWGGYLINLGKITGGQVTRTAGYLKSALDVQLFTDDTPQGSGSSDEEADSSTGSAHKTSSPAVMLPWADCRNPPAVKAQILALSKDRQNFLSGPPAGTEFKFEYTSCHELAQLMLERDKNLKEMRFGLVPKQIREETFWVNYFYRVELIKQSAENTSLTAHSDVSSDRKGEHAGTLAVDPQHFDAVGGLDQSEEPDLDDFEVVNANDLESTAG